LHAAFVLAIVSSILIPVIPGKYIPIQFCDDEGKCRSLSAVVEDWERKISIKQGWQMYAPNPQRAHIYMNLTAIYPDGTERELEETLQEHSAWGTHWLWDKTRVDIWRQYANFNPRKRNRNRIWYLRGVCVREARRGDIPQRIVMYAVRRRFTPPEQVRAGKPGLGKPRRELVTVQYCKTPQLLEMIEQDRANRGELDG
jgi:hypothetical protein